MAGKEQKQQKQITRFTTEELDLIHRTFENNEPLVKAIRKKLLQFPLTAVELSILSLVKEDALKVIRKALCPKITGDEPMLMVSDHFTSIGLRELQPAVGVLHLKAISIWKKYMEQELDILEGKEVARPVQIWQLEQLDTEADELQYYVNMFARNNIINGIESGLYQLYVLGNTKNNESPEDTIKRLNQDSAK